MSPRAEGIMFLHTEQCLEDDWLGKVPSVRLLGLGLPSNKANLKAQFTELDHRASGLRPLLGKTLCLLI